MSMGPNSQEVLVDNLQRLMKAKGLSAPKYAEKTSVTYRYVNEILNRYRTYNTILSVAEEGSLQFRGVMGIKTGTY